MARKSNRSRAFLLKLLVVLSVWMQTGCKKNSIYIDHAKPEVTLSAGNLNLFAPVIHLSADTVYILAVSINRDSGQILQIDAGTLIKVKDRLSINIRRGASLQAAGTAEKPIVLTSANPKGGVGVGSGATGGEHYWYGVRIYGSTDGVGPLSSGEISYLRIEFAGGNEGSLGLAEALPAFLLENVSEATTVSNIEVSYSFEVPAFGFVGGTVNARNLISYAATGVDFYIHQGYTGKLQQLLAYRHPYFAATAGIKSSLSGVLIEDPGTFPAISNLTVLGPGPQQSRSYVYGLTTSGTVAYRVAGLITTAGAQFHLCNSVILGFPHTCWYMDDQATATSFAYGVSDFTFSYFQTDDTTQPFFLDPSVYSPFTSDDFKRQVLQPGFSNLFVGIYTYSGLYGAIDYDDHPDPVPASGSPLLSGAHFQGVFTDAFFDQTGYVGAVGTNSWLKSWTNFLPLQTDYNN